MRTDKQIRASRENAKKSTGPCTPKGKANSSKNALKHGLLAEDAVIPGEDPAEFDRHLTSVETTYLPRNYVEQQIVRQIADTMWRIKRLSRIETTVISASIERTRVYQHDYRVERIRQGHEGDLQLLGESMFGGTKFLNNLARYDGHLRRCLHRDLELMMRIRREDEKARAAFDAEEDLEAAPGHGPPSGRKRYVPEQAPPPIRNGAYQDHEPPEDHPRPDIGFRPAEPQTPKLRNKAEPNLTRIETMSYEATGAIVSPQKSLPIPRSAGLKETRGLN